MSATLIILVGIFLIVMAIFLLVASIIYRNTAGKRIREQLRQEYQNAE